MCTWVGRSVVSYLERYDIGRDFLPACCASCAEQSYPYSSTWELLLPGLQQQKASMQAERDEETPSKRRRTDQETPATVPSRKLNDMRLCVELGNLAARTARHQRFNSKEMYGPLLIESKQDWFDLDKTLLDGYRPTMIAIDVEMIELDGEQLPISAAILAYDSPRLGVEPRILFDGLVKPCENWEARSAEIIWKTEIHGISETDFKQSDSEISDLSRIWSIIRNEFHDLTFLVGHRLSGDLKALKICGKVLGRRVLDTSLLHWCRGPPSLATLAATTNSNYLLTHLSAHDAKADAIMAATVLLDDLAMLTTNLSVNSLSSTRTDTNPCISSPSSLSHKEQFSNRMNHTDNEPNQNNQQEAVVLFDDKCVGRLIGKGGTTISEIKARSSSVFVELAPRSFRQQGSSILKRKLAICGEHISDIDTCLDHIASIVPCIAPNCIQARLSTSPPY